MRSSDPPCLQIQKGVSGARSDDTKSLKSVIIDWITPTDQPLNPPLPRNVKTARGFNHDRTGFLLCPVGLDWTNAEYGYCLFRTSQELTLHRIRESLRDGQLLITGEQWPIFLYKDYLYDTNDPWKGLLRSQIIVSVSLLPTCVNTSDDFVQLGIQTYLYIPEFCGQRTSRHSFRQCSHSQYDARNPCINCMHRHSSLYVYISMVT